MTTITVQAPQRVAAPRGAVLGAWAFQAVITAVERLNAAHQARALRREMSARISDAAGVRRYAQRMEQYDARFAADLYAAADRHENLGK